ncbi:MAG TPA: HAMP domain-containing sensor histidine kinase [Burkholderiales bacterium]|nr:HAMP domain-containing sensor histidine kinase [Burkholderiales bacterium]
MDIRSRTHPLAFLSDRPLPLAGIFAVALAFGEIVIDWATWIDLNVSIVYTLPLVLAAFARDRRLLWGLVTLLVTMTFVVYAMQIPRGVFALHEPFFVDRVLSAITQVVTAGLLQLWMTAIDTLDAQAGLLREQNAQLEAANRELLARGELIARQNEELDRRRREAEEASERKTRLLVSASHDLRTPANAISTMAEVLRRATADRGTPDRGTPDRDTADRDLAAQVPRVAQRLQAAALSLAELLSEVLDFARLDAGDTELRESEFSLNDLLATQCRDLVPLAEAKHLRLELELPDRPLWLRTDRVKLGRVIANLVGNAIKFTQHGGVWLSTAFAPDGRVLIRVRDTGPGIPQQELDRVFGEFFQLSQPGGARSEGWGLGLAICRQLTNALGGDITVESRAPQGSVFTVRMPAACVLAA